MASLAVGVTLMGDNGLPVHFPIGTAKADLPAWAVDRISNPAVWSGAEEPNFSAEPERQEAETPQPAPPEEPSTPAVVPDGGTDSAEPERRAPVTAVIGSPPPKRGAGSGVEAWSEYARKAGVDVPDDAKRDDIVAACEAADVPTE